MGPQEDEESRWDETVPFLASVMHTFVKKRGKDVVSL
jgi:hypothetical protein